MTTEPIPVNEKLRVVIADDDPTIRMIARMAMEHAGFEVIEATDGVQAIEAIRSCPPDLVLLDVTMPVMDGYTACSMLRRLPDSERIPVIIITGLDDIDSINQAYNAGATDFVSKPVNWAVLRHRVRYIMRASRALNDAWENQTRLANAQRVAELGDWEWDVKRARFHASEQVHRILGKLVSLTSMESLLEDLHGDDVERVRAIVDAAVERAEPSTFDHRIVMPSGEVRFVHHQVTCVRADENGRAIRLVGTVQDITRRKLNEESIRELAYRDSLTGLPNRLLLIEQVRSALAHASRSASKIAILFVDLDDFKRVNDTLGHDAGDVLLRVVADRISRSVRMTDAVSRVDIEDARASIARLGGDEFIVLLAQIKQPEESAVVAQRMLQALMEPVQVANQDVVVTCSIGIAISPDDGDSAETLLMNADAAMYQAKGKGRNTFQFYDRSMNATARHTLNIENALRHAIERNELELHYQPKADIATNAIVGVEALLRWRNLDNGWVPPQQLLEIARQAQLLVPIEDWVVRTACRAAAEWRDLGGTRLPVSINLSGSYLRRAELVPTIERLLDEFALDPSLIEVEISSAVLMDDTDMTVSLIGRLCDLGVGFALDDFGASFAPLAHLKRLPIGALKIDQSVVANLEYEPSHEALCRSIIVLAHGLGSQAIATGVTSARQLNRLLELGCDHYQGDLFCPPIHADEISRRIETSLSAEA